MGGDLVLPLARSRAGFDSGLCKGLLMAFSPAGLESAEKEACHFPGHVSCFGNGGSCLLSGLDHLLLWKKAVLCFGSVSERGGLRLMVKIPLFPCRGEQL